MSSDVLWWSIEPSLRFGTPGVTLGVPEGVPSLRKSTSRTALGEERKRRRLVSEQERIVVVATVFLANLLFRRDSRVWRSALITESPSYSTSIAPSGASAGPISRRLALSHARRVRGHPVPGQKMRLPLLENLKCPDYIGCGQRSLVCLPPNPLFCAIGLRPNDTLRGALTSRARKRWERRGSLPQSSGLQSFAELGHRLVSRPSEAAFRL